MDLKTYAVQVIEIRKIILNVDAEDVEDAILAAQDQYDEYDLWGEYGGTDIEVYLGVVAGGR